MGGDPPDGVWQVAAVAWFRSGSFEVTTQRSKANSSIALLPFGGGAEAHRPSADDLGSNSTRVDRSARGGRAFAAQRVLPTVRPIPWQNGIASGKLGKGERDVRSNSETFRRNPAGNQSRPGEPGPHPKTSLASRQGDLPGEA